MDKKFPTLKILASLIAAVLFLTGCQPKSTETPLPDGPEITATEQVTLPKPGEPFAISQDITIDPAVTEDIDSLLVSRYLYEGLVRLDDNGDVQPGLASSWIISDDQLDYIFTIRPNAQFSDGTPITTDIIVDNFNRWFDPQSPLHGDGNYPSWKAIFLGFNGERDAENKAVSQVDGVQKVDQNLVIVHLNRPVPELLQYLASPAFSILSVDALSSGNYDMRDNSVITSGPYLIASWTDSGLTLAPSKSYWNPAEGNIEFIWK